MPDDVGERAVASGPRTSPPEIWDVQFWLHELGCTEDELRAAVQAVGLLPRLLPLREKLLAEPLSAK